MTSIGESVSLQDQLDVILEGLPNEFESLVTLINSKIEWFDLEEIRALLLAHEQRLDKARITEEAASLNFTQSQPNSKTPNSVNPNSATETQIAPQANWTTYETQKWPFMHYALTIKHAHQHSDTKSPTTPISFHATFS